MNNDPTTNSCAGIDDVIATEELTRRPARSPDYEAENRALAALAKEMARNPHGVLQKLSELILDLCHAHSAGISVLEDENGGVFRWHAAAGVFAANIGKTMPRETSPCATVIQRNSVLLFNEPERCFPVLRGIRPCIRESLLAPWTVDERPTGTVWAIAHDPKKQFDAEDARLLQSLATFAAAAYRMNAALEESKTGKQALEQRVEERTCLLLKSNETLQQEIAQRAQAEAKMRESEERLRHTLNIDTVGVMYFDMAGRLIDANDAFLAMSGYNRADLTTEDVTWQRMTPPEWMPASEQAFAQLHAQGKTIPYEKEYIRKDGSRWWGLFAAKLLNDGMAVEFVIDITERKEAEQALTNADRRKDEFLATLAHELRNPLAPISNAMQLLKVKGGRRATDQLIEMVQRQVNHIVRLVDDLMDVSRIATGKIELQKAPAALADILHGAIETSKPLMDSGRHRLHVSLPPDEMMLDADVVRLTQVFSNLLNNAAKYTDEGGEIRLAARRDGAQAVVTVRDNGIGIPPPMLPYVFEMFAQIHRTGNPGHEGLGIGLSMVRSLIELHGGAVEAHSEGPGHGSEFIVRLPLLEKPPDRFETDADPAANVRKPLSGRRVLVVDDNDDAAESLGMLLAVRGAETRVANSGPAALTTLDEWLPHAVVLDIGMPGMNGYEVAQHIRRQPRYAGIRLIALTGWGQETDRNHSRASGFDRHLTKPVDIAALESDLMQEQG
jgi:PAS domain S-box-containing protein